ncbi:phage tail protein I [Aliarcobacter butzleri]|uniref:phage tail protein I n=1 Tax=Aliarcobacter butzleri TaxID=28197 RepID=UPI003AFAC3EE
MGTQSLIPSFEAIELHSSDIVAGNVVDTLSSEIEAVKTLANPLLCEAEYLPYLAYAYKVDFWNDFIGTAEKRKLIQKSMLLHQRKGTLWAIEEVLDLVGFTDRANNQIADVKEGLKLTSRDGTYRYDAIFNHFSDEDWAKYVIYVPKAISVQKAEFARKLIQEYAPKRCILVAVVYQQLPNRDGSYFYNNDITHGTIGVANG